MNYIPQKFLFILFCIAFTQRASINQPVEREQILKEGWGDKGDYLGRTLAIYISKLRKKLEPDASWKVENIRGVGYRLAQSQSQ